MKNLTASLDFGEVTVPVGDYPQASSARDLRTAASVELAFQQSLNRAAYLKAIKEWTIDTQANLLASTPLEGRVGLCTDGVIPAVIGFGYQGPSWHGLNGWTICKIDDTDMVSSSPTTPLLNVLSSTGTKTITLSPGAGRGFETIAKVYPGFAQATGAAFGIWAGIGLFDSTTGAAITFMNGIDNISESMSLRIDQWSDSSTITSSQIYDCVPFGHVCNRDIVLLVSQSYETTPLGFYINIGGSGVDPNFSSYLINEVDPGFFPDEVTTCALATGGTNGHRFAHIHYAEHG